MSIYWLMGTPTYKRCINLVGILILIDKDKYAYSKGTKIGRCHEAYASYKPISLLISADTSYICVQGQSD